MERTVLHCDLNSFFASVELLDRPGLRASGAPAAVCGDPQARHGIILAKNDAAKAMGVKTAETIWQARSKCPSLVLLPAHYDKYAFYSRAVNEIYSRYTDLVEPFSIDESWLDITGSMHLFGGDGRAIADTIRRTVRDETGLTISVGVSFNKVFAKMGSDYKKPDATTVITRENFRTLLWPLPVTDLLFVGRSSAATLREYGVETIGDLARFDREALIALLGKQGALLHDYANGAEHENVVPVWEQPGPKSIGNGFTFRHDLMHSDEVRAGVAFLTDEVAERLRREGLKCAVLQVTIRASDFRSVCRRKRLETPTYLARELTAAALDIIAAEWPAGSPIRALTVTAQSLVGADESTEQLSLFSPGEDLRREKLEKLERTVDRVREKYGKETLRLALAGREELGLVRPADAADGEITI